MLLKGSSPEARTAAAWPRAARCSHEQVDLNLLIGEFWLRAARRGAVVSAFWVPSRQNLADVPTRESDKVEEMQALLAAGFRRVEWAWPVHRPWS